MIMIFNNTHGPREWLLSTSRISPLKAGFCFLPTAPPPPPPKCHSHKCRSQSLLLPRQDSRRADSNESNNSRPTFRLFRRRNRACLGHSEPSATLAFRCGMPSKAVRARGPRFASARSTPSCWMRSSSSCSRARLVRR
jgi:hypothetical protein